LGFLFFPNLLENIHKHGWKTGSFQAFTVFRFWRARADLQSFNEFVWELIVVSSNIMVNHVRRLIDLSALSEYVNVGIAQMDSLSGFGMHAYSHLGIATKVTP
jgi:hypothetical protein